MDSPTGKRVLTSSQDNFIMQARVPESVIWQWGLSPWKQVSTEWLALCLAKNGNPLLGRGTWAWHSKFLSFLSFGSWLMPSVHYQKKKKPAFGQLSWSKCRRLLSSSGKEREAAETQTAGRFQKPQCGAGSSGRGLVPGSEKSISISPFQMKLMQFNQSDETVKLLIILCIFHASVTGRLEIWGDSSVYFSKKKKKMKENC